MARMSGRLENGMGLRSLRLCHRMVPARAAVFNHFRLSARPGSATMAHEKGGLMPQTITTGYKALVEAAEREIETVPAEEAIKLAGRDDVVLVDIRDIRELQREGKVPGAFHCPRGMLEFWIDPQAPITSRSSPRTRGSCSSVPAAYVRAAAQTAQRWGSTRRPHRRRLRRLEEAGGRSSAATSRAAEEGVNGAHADHRQ